MIRWTLVALSVVLYATAGFPTTACGFFGVEAGLEYEDNATRAVFDSDRESEWFGRALVDGGRRYRTDSFGSISLRLGLEGQLATQAELLTQLSPGVDLTWRRKLGLGRTPVVGLTLSGKWLGYRSEIRRGWLGSIRANYSHPLGDRWKFLVEAGYLQRNADSEAFDQQAWHAQGGLDVWLRPTTRLSVTYRYRDGDVTSTATPASTDPRVSPILDRSTARAPDDAYPDKVAYRLDGRTHVLRIGVDQALGRHGGIGLSYEYRLTGTFDDFDYHNALVRVSYIHVF